MPKNIFKHLGIAHKILRYKETRKRKRKITKKYQNVVKSLALEAEKKRPKRKNKIED